MGDIRKGTSLYIVQNLHLLCVQPCVISKSGHVGQYGFLYTVPVKCMIASPYSSVTKFSSGIRLKCHALGFAFSEG